MPDALDAVSFDDLIGRREPRSPWRDQFDTLVSQFQNYEAAQPKATPADMLSSASIKELPRLDALPNSDGRSTLMPGPAATWRDDLADVMGSLQGGDATHKNANYRAVDALSLLPPVGAVLGVNEAQHMHEQGAPVAAAGLGLLNMLPGGRGAKKVGGEALEALTREVEPLAARYRELFGKPFLTPKAPPGTPLDQVIAGERQSLEALKSTIARKEAELAKRIDVPTTPKLERSTKEEDLAAALGQIDSNPYASVRGQGGRFISKSDERKLANEAVNKLGMKLPEGPWGTDPKAYQRMLQDAQEIKTGIRTEAAENRKQLAAINKARANAMTSAEVKRLDARVKELEGQKVKLEAAMAQLNKMMLNRRKD